MSQEPESEFESESGSEDWKAIDVQILAGRKIQAIKLYREATGQGLKEAKDAVELREVQLREESPEKFTSSSARGCMGMLLLAVGATASIAGAAAWLSA